MASAQIGALRVGLSLDSAQFHTGLKQARASTSAFNRTIAPVAAAAARVALSFGAAAAGALSFRSAMDGTKRALEAFSKVADAAARTGLDSEFLQGAAYQ